MNLWLPTCLLLVSATASAQFSSERPLIAAEDSHPIPGIPLSGAWTRQTFVGDDREFITTVDGGFLDLVEHDRIHWEADTRTYRGIVRGRSTRVLPLGDSRNLFERDMDGRHATRVTLAEWVDGEIHLFNFETGDASAFARHMHAHGVQVDGGVVHGERSAVLEALRTLELGQRELDSRLRRPSHAEMGLIWSYFELERWADQQNDLLAQVEDGESRMQRLGDLHLAHRIASHAYYPALAGLDPLAIDDFDFGRWHDGDFKRLVRRAKMNLQSIEARLEARMEWLAENIEIVEHEERELDPERPWDFVQRPSPGQALEFHVTAERADGAVIVDTRKEDRPWQAAVMGDLPEGIQYALRTLGFEETITVRIPSQLAFGTEHGDVEVELEIVRGLPDGSERPPLGGLLGYRVPPVEAEETPSGLRYRDLVVGEGAAPRRGERVKLRSMAWDVFDRVLDEPSVQTIELGGSAMLAGVSEGLASMKVGGKRVLFVPRHLADSKPERSGMAQCVVVELLGVAE